MKEKGKRITPPKNKVKIKRKKKGKRDKGREIKDIALNSDLRAQWMSFVPCESGDKYNSELAQACVDDRPR